MSELVTDETLLGNEKGADIREDIVQTAVKFLQNHNVINTPLVQKQKFLQKKGLSDEEIREACERAGAYQQHERHTVVPLTAPIRYSDQRQLQTWTYFDRFKEIVHNLALISAITYAIYKFYTRYIRPYLFGGPKRKSIEESLEDIDKKVSTSIDDIKDSIGSVRIEIDRIRENGDVNLQRQLSDLKSDISAVKGILVSRKQFPSVSNASVSIPAWQLLSTGDDQPDADIDVKSEYLMEMGSASGSEHEHATKTSESSLEIME